jgi:hypothetical protein
MHFSSFVKMHYKLYNSVNVLLQLNICLRTIRFFPLRSRLDLDFDAIVFVRYEGSVYAQLVPDYIQVLTEQYLDEHARNA